MRKPLLQIPTSRLQESIPYVCMRAITVQQNSLRVRMEIRNRHQTCIASCPRDDEMTQVHPEVLNSDSDIYNTFGRMPCQRVGDALAVPCFSKGVECYRVSLRPDINKILYPRVSMWPHMLISIMQFRNEGIHD